jgi:hypothetical protein
VLDGHELIHELLVNVQASSRIYDDHVEPEGAGFRDRPLRPGHRVQLPGRVVDAQ